MRALDPAETAALLEAARPYRLFIPVLLAVTCGLRARTVALTTLAMEELHRHKKRQAEELLRVGVRQTDDTYVVAQADGQPLKPNSLTHEFVRFVAGPALPRVRFHDLRHSHASHLPASGVHPKVAQERLGHATVAITLDL